MTRRNRGLFLCVALLTGAAAGLTVATAQAVEVRERSIPPAGDQGDASQGGGQPGSQAAQASGGGKPQSLEARVERMEHMLEGGTLVDMLNRLDTLQQQLQKMQGDLEVQQHDLQALRQHQRDLYLDLDRRLRKLEAAPSAAGGGKPQSLEARVERMEHMLEGGTLVDMLNRLDTLQQQLQKMQGDLEVQQHDLQALRQHQRDLYLDLDRRLRKLEAAPSAANGGQGGQAQGGAGAPAAAGAAGAGAAAGAQAQPPASGAPSSQPGAAGTAGGAAAAAAPASPQDQQQMQADYDQAFQLLRGAQYDKAIAAFEQFLKKYPQGPLSDNAQYWLGEANYVIRRFPEALKDFQQVVSRYPGSPKVPDAELKAGFTHYELDQWDDARKVLTEVAKKYPDTTAAKLAQNRLQRMKKEGH